MCGIFGFAKADGRQSDNQLDILKRVFTEVTDESSIRGTDSTGFSIIDTDNRYTYKTLLDSSTLVDSDSWDKDILSKITRDTTIVIGHVRLATQGSIKVHNAHPFNIGEVTGAHNGIIYNYNEVAKQLGKNSPEVDSQVLFQSLNKNKQTEAFENIDGDFAITWVKDSNKKIHLARESGRPMVVAYWKKARTLFWASTKDILLDAMTRAGLVLPVSKIPEDYIYTYDVDKFDGRPNRLEEAFNTISQYNTVSRNIYGNTRQIFSGWGDYHYYGYNGYRNYKPSPATKSLLGSTNTTASKEMCSYCYEWVSVDEIWTDANHKRVCFDCEYFPIIENDIGDKTDEDSCPF